MNVRNASRGQVLIVMALALVALIGLAGIAIDSGRAYGVRAKLSAAVDAAALGAGRALASGNDDGERLANARAAGAEFYYANFPADYFGASLAAPAIDAVHNAQGYWQVSATGSASMPVLFMPVVGFGGPVQVASSSYALRRDVDVVLVLDTSGSLGNPPGTLDALKNAAINNFVDRFAAGPGGDRVALVSFASGSPLPPDVPIDTTASRGFVRATVVAAIGALTVSGSTAQAEGMRRALDQLNSVPVALRSSLRVIVFFSDGAPNGVPATFTRTPGGQQVTGDLYSETAGPDTSRATRVWDNQRRDTQLGTYNDIATLPATGLGGIALAGARPLTGTPIANTRCNVNKAARNMVENVASAARTQGMLIMSVGLGAALQSLEINFCGYGASENGEHILKRLANAADSDTLMPPPQPQGLYCYAGDASQLPACFDRIASAILRLVPQP
jgi:Flp pilus assembly protein TadG